MKIIAISSTEFHMESETEADQAFLDSLHFNEKTIHVERFLPSKTAAGWVNSGVIFSTDKTGQQALATQAGRECLGAFRQLAGLLKGHFSCDRVVGRDTANPQANE